MAHCISAAGRASSNDITLAKNGAAYISDTPNGRIFRVSRGSKQLELFARDEQLKGIDGIVFSGDGTLYANSVTTNKLWRIAIGKDGNVGPIADLTPSEPLKGADGFRLIRVERKIEYVTKPELKGQDPGPFTVLALPLPAE